MTTTAEPATSAKSATPCVVVRDLAVALSHNKEKLVVRDVHFEIAKGEVLGVVGESGSGKTTTGLALLGLARRGLSIYSGSVTVDGVDILGLDAAGLRKARGSLVAYVPQDPASALNPAMRIGEQISEAIRAHSDCLLAGETVESRTEQLLVDVSLPATEATLRSYPHQMSGGQQQRVGIAIAMAARPALIVFDEPTTGLDVTTQRNFLELVRKLTAGSGISAVYVSHDLPVVSEIADRTAVMFKGELVEIGQSSELFARPRHPYTRKLIAAAPSFEKEPEPVELHHPATPSPTVILECDSVRAFYGSREVLSAVDVRLEKGCCVAVVGESGSGKTTFARSLIGLHHEWTGTVTLDGESLGQTSSSRSKEQRRRFQYIFQSPYNSLNPRRTVGDIVNEPLEFFFNDLNRSDREARVSKAFGSVSLPQHYLNRYPGQLSGGERQRVSLARALVVDPEVILCDEVTSALDVSVQAEILEELRELQASRNLSMLFITHNLAVVRAIAQEVVVLRHGVIVEHGLVDDVLDHPQHEYTQRLLADVPKLQTGAPAT